MAKTDITMLVKWKNDATKIVQSLKATVAAFEAASKGIQKAVEDSVHIGDVTNKLHAMVSEFKDASKEAGDALGKSIKVAPVAKKAAEVADAVRESTTEIQSSANGITLDPITSKLTEIANRFRTDIGKTVKVTTRYAADDVQRLSMQFTGLNIYGAEGTVIFARLKEELKALGKVDISRSAWTNQGKVYGRISASIVKDSSKAKTGIAAFAASFGAVVKAARPYIAVLTGVGNAIIKVYTVVGKLAAALVKIPLNIIQNVAQGFASLSKSILKISFSAIQKISQGILGIGKAILSIPGNVIANTFGRIGNSLRNIGTIIAGMIGFTGLKALGREFSQVISEMGTIESLRVVFANFVQQARAHIDGFSTSSNELIGQMQRITGGSLDLTTMLKQSNLAFALIGESVGKDLPKMMAIAQAASLATGQTIEYTIESMVKGIGRLSTRWIDNLGISIDATTEYERYAKEIDKTAASLTQAEKIQSFLNATMREGTKIIERVGDVTLFLDTQMNALKTIMTNTRDAVITNFAPILTVILGMINEMGMKGFQKINDFTIGFVDAFAQVPRIIGFIAGEISNTISSISIAPGEGPLAGLVRDISSVSIPPGTGRQIVEPIVQEISSITLPPGIGPRFVEPFIEEVSSITIPPGTGTRLVEPFVQEISSISIPPGIRNRIIEPFESAQQEMGYKAGNWAINALTWGANVGANFASGILKGFMQIIAGVMNAIASVLTFWFAPGSPPNILPNIDLWGEEAIGEWVKGMLNYPIGDNLAKVKEDLQDTLGKEVRDSLFQEAVDSMASWAKGLSIADMEFLTKSIDRAITKAKILNEELTKSYKKQSNELFKMLVLQKDPSAIRAQITKTKNTKSLLATNERELEILEARNKIVQDQLELMRQLQAAIEKQKSGADKADKDSGGGADSGSIEDMLDEIAKPLTGTGGLASRIARIRETLTNIFKKPLEQIKQTFLDNLPQVQRAWENLLGAFEISAPRLSNFFTNFQTVAEMSIKTVKGLFMGLSNELLGTDYSQIQDFSGVPEEQKAGIPRNQYGGPQDIEPLGLRTGEALGKGLKSALAGIKAAIENALPEVKNAIGGFFDGAIEKLKTKASDLWGTIKTEAARIKSILSIAISEIFNGASMEDQLVNAGVPADKLHFILPEDYVQGHGVAEQIETLFDGIRKSITDLSEDSDLVSGIVEFFDGIKEGVATFVETAGPDMLKLIGHLQDLGEALAGLFTTLFGGEEAGSTFSALGKILGETARVLSWPVDQLAQALTALVLAMDNFISAAQRWRDSDPIGAIKEGAEGLLNIGKIYRAPLMAVSGAFAKEGDVTIPVNVGLGMGLGQTVREWISSNIIPSSTDKSDVESAFTGLGEDITSGIVGGLDALLPASAITTVMQETESAARLAVGARSPSTAFKGIARDMLLGMVEGLRVYKILAMAEIFLIMQEMLEQVHIIFLPKFGTLGEFLMKGFASGITAGTKWVIDAVVAAFNAAMKALRDAGETHSPSRVTERFGKNLMQGEAIGINKNAFMPISAAAESASSVLSAMGAADARMQNVGRGRYNDGSDGAVTINGPIVENMVVPNMQVGREMIREINNKIGDSIRYRRMP